MSRQEVYVSDRRGETSLLLSLDGGANPQSVKDVLTEGRTVLSNDVVHMTDGKRALRWEVHPPITEDEIPKLAQQLASRVCGDCVLIAPQFR